MDGIHDMGGKQGFGAVEVDEVDEPFHHDWEGRKWAIARTCSAPDWTLDWWRHVRERIDPVDYLSRPYFDSWMQTYAAAFVTSGVFTLDEITSGHTDQKGPPAKAQDLAGALEANQALCRNFESPAHGPPSFNEGDAVSTVAHGNPHHSRLPQYARGKPAIIHAYRGSHLFANAGARGIHEGQHLYTVAIAASDLWGTEANPRDTVYLDLWESHLEQV